MMSDQVGACDGVGKGATAALEAPSYNYQSIRISRSTDLCVARITSVPISSQLPRFVSLRALI